MSLLDRSLKPAVRQLVIDGLIVRADLGIEVAEGHRGNRRDLFVAYQRGFDPLGTGDGRHCEQRLWPLVSHFFTPSMVGRVDARRPRWKAGARQTDVPVIV